MIKTKYAPTPQAQMPEKIWLAPAKKKGTHQLRYTSMNDTDAVKFFGEDHEYILASSAALPDDLVRVLRNCRKTLIGLGVKSGPTLSQIDDVLAKVENA